MNLVSWQILPSLVKCLETDFFPPPLSKGAETKGKLPPLVTAANLAQSVS